MAERAMKRDSKSATNSPDSRSSCAPANPPGNSPLAAVQLRWPAFVLLLPLTARGAAQQYSILHSFAGGTNADGGIPTSTLIASGETLYGTTAGGVDDFGTIFRINTNGGDYAVLFRCGGMPDAYPSGRWFFPTGGSTAQRGGVRWPGTLAAPPFSPSPSAITSSCRDAR